MLRNPGIVNLFQRIDYIEKMGTGIERICLSLKEAKIPQAQYELMSSFVKAVFPKATESSERTTQETMLRLIRLNPYTTREELGIILNCITIGVVIKDLTRERQMWLTGQHFRSKKQQYK